MLIQTVSDKFASYPSCYHKSCYDKSIENKFVAENLVKGITSEGHIRTTITIPEVAPQAEPEVEKCVVSKCENIVNKQGYYCSDKSGNPYCKEHSYLLLDKCVENNIDKLEASEPEVAKTMNIYAKNGDLVVSTDRNGTDYDKEKVLKYLEVGGVYTVDHTEVGGYHTDVYLKGCTGIAFNSVCFIDYKPTEPEEKKEKIGEISVKRKVIDRTADGFNSPIYGEPEESEVEVIKELGDTYIGCQDGIDLWEVGKLEDKIKELVRTVNRLSKEIKLRKENLSTNEKSENNITMSGKKKV